MASEFESREIEFGGLELLIPWWIKLGDTLKWTFSLGESTNDDVEVQEEQRRIYHVVVAACGWSGGFDAGWQGVYVDG